MSTSRSSSLHLAFDPLFFEHRSRGYHPERPERLAAAQRGVEAVGREGAIITTLAPRDARRDEILRAHDAAYVDRLLALSGRETALDADTYVAPRSIDAALRSAGGALALVDALLADGGARQGAALLRPPGHHATRDQAMGFCLLNNIAIAALSALASGVGRVAIVDWDVHHGNGTQDIFWSDGRVLFVSLHEAPLYPGTGAVTEAGEGAGLGRVLNVPMPAAANDACYALAFDEVVLPAVRDFAPELVLISAGFDAHVRDPLASMEVTEAGFAFMGRALREVAEETARGRVGLLLEGGYDLTALEGSTAAAVRGVLGWDVGKPSGPVSEGHREALEAAKDAHRLASRSRAG